jgi:cholesterol transport system auxiliary component
MARSASSTAAPGVDIVRHHPQKVHKRGRPATVAARYPLEYLMGRFTKNLRLATFAGAMSLLAGCAVLGGGTPQLDTFVLRAPNMESRAGRGRLQILIAEPAALKPLDSENIVIKPGPDSIEYLKGAQWADRLTRLVQVRLAETFQRGGSIAGVGTPGQGLAIDYQVVTEIRAFEVRVDGAARAEADIFVKLLNDRNGTVRAARSFTASVPVGSSGNDAYARALNEAFGRVAAEIVDWTNASI